MVRCLPPLDFQAVLDAVGRACFADNHVPPQQPPSDGAGTTGSASKTSPSTVVLIVVGVVLAAALGAAAVVYGPRLLRRKARTEQASTMGSSLLSSQSGMEIPHATLDAPPALEGQWSAHGLQARPPVPPAPVVAESGPVMESGSGEAVATVLDV